MGSAVELTDVHDVTFVLEHRSFVVVNVEVIRSREDGHHRRESCRLRFTVHPITEIYVNGTSENWKRYIHIPCILGFVRANDGQKVVSLQKLTCCLIPAQ